MSPSRLVATALGSAVFSFLLCSALSCGTDAVGVDDCRQIEEARCEAASKCDGPLRVDDVEACKRYYRDHCLHGLGVPDEPGSPVVRRCVEAIEVAGSCAAVDPGTSLADCDPARLTATSDARIQDVCDVVQYPEGIGECEFLLEEPPAPAATTTGEAGGGGASGS